RCCRTQRCHSTAHPTPRRQRQSPLKRHSGSSVPNSDTSFLSTHLPSQRPLSPFGSSWLPVSLEDTTKKQCLTLSPCSLSPALSTNPSPQHQMIEEPQRGRRSSRTRFTEKQLETLQGVFEATPYPREEEYDRLSAILSLPNRVIVVWFQNARQRARKNQDQRQTASFKYVPSKSPPPTSDSRDTALSLLSTCCQTNNLNTPKMQSHSGPKRNSLN
uniref:Homeobox domain-containing protein n=1 Tax=Poecilia latipinna TaxID=48699 RepID=A0A3B3U7T9_9TELE